MYFHSLKIKTIVSSKSTFKNFFEPQPSVLFFPIFEGGWKHRKRRVLLSPPFPTLETALFHCPPKDETSSWIECSFPHHQPPQSTIHYPLSLATFAAAFWVTSPFIRPFFSWQQVQQLLYHLYSLCSHSLSVLQINKTTKSKKVLINNATK